jgi:hypothetical protein
VKATVNVVPAPTGRRPLSAVQRVHPAGIEATVPDQMAPIPDGTAPADAETQESSVPPRSAIGMAPAVGVVVGCLPWSSNALRLATCVSEATTNGGVPGATDELICPEMAMPPVPTVMPVLPTLRPSTFGTPATVEPPT